MALKFLPGYERGVKIGSGTYGSVHLYHNPSDKRTLAVKDIPYRVAHATAKEIRELVERECQVLKYLQKECDPHFLCVLDCFHSEEHDRSYIVTEFLGDHVDLYDWIKREKSLGLRRNFAATYMICFSAITGLQHLHRLGVAHRDIKVENLLVELKTFQVRYIDFGFSCFEDAKTVDPSGRCTNQPLFEGTPQYMAPELLFKTATAGFLTAVQADIWALGCSLFAVLTGADFLSVAGMYMAKEKKQKVSPEVLRDQKKKLRSDVAFLQEAFRTLPDAPLTILREYAPTPPIYSVVERNAFEQLRVCIASMLAYYPTMRRVFPLAPPSVFPLEIFPPAPVLVPEHKAAPPPTEERKRTSGPSSLKRAKTSHMEEPRPP